jgi:hypothetical protein
MNEKNLNRDFLNKLTFEPLTKSNWDKFVRLFGEKGACGNCWCMYYRLSRADYVEGKTNEGNKKAMKEIVWNNKPAGILGCYEGEAVAWCAFAPREDFLKLRKSRVHKPIDKKIVWSIPCFFIDKNVRRKGVSVELLKGVIAYAEDNNIEVIEAYPTIPAKENLPDSFAWTGLNRSFECAGFEVADRTSKNRPMVRYYITK